MTVALVDAADGSIAIGHVGDSRAYRVRGEQLEQLTDDHSLVGELLRSGKLSPEEAEVHPQRSVITRALGTEPDVDVDTFTVAAEPGDLYLLCSDGLTSMVSDGEIQALLVDNTATSTRRRAPSSTRRTRAAARTTSPSSSSRSPATAAVEQTGPRPPSERPAGRRGRRGHAVGPRTGSGRRHRSDPGRGDPGAPAAGRAEPRRAEAPPPACCPLLAAPAPRSLAIALLTIWGLSALTSSQPRAALPDRSRSAHRHRLRERLHRAVLARRRRARSPTPASSSRSTSAPTS